MTPRLSVTAFRLVVLVAVWVLGTSTLSLAQEDEAPETQPPVLPAEPIVPVEAAEPLLVPDVHGLPLVFAKGVLEDAGFAWKVKGKVEGYAVNLVATQSAAPGTSVVDNGAPTLVLELRTNPAYDELGLPMNESPYPGTKLILAETDAAGSAETDAGSDGSDAGAGATEDPAPEGDAPSDAGSVEDPGEGQADGGEGTDVELAGAEDAADEESATRPPAFAVPSAPAEPLDEMPLPERATKLLEWAEQLDKISSSALDHYAYQHAWVVTGASFGWWRGAEALRTLIRVDETMQARFDIGRENEAQARAALAEVERKSKQ